MMFTVIQGNGVIITMPTKVMLGYSKIKFIAKVPSQEPEENASEFDVA